MGGHIQEKKGNWYCVIEQGRGEDGKRLPPKWISVRKELGLNKKAGITQARKLLIKLLAEQQKGTLIHPADTPVKDFLEMWLDEYKKLKNLAPLTIELYERAIRLHINPDLGETPLSKLTAQRLQRLLMDKLETMSANSVGIIHKVLFGAFAYGIKFDYLHKNPMNSVTRPTIKKPDMGFWTEEEASQFLAAAKGHNLYALYLLTLTTGLRKSEVLNLKWENIKGNSIEVKGTKTEKSERVVEVSPKTMAEVLAQKSCDEYVFIGRNGTPHYEGNLNYNLDKLCKKAGVKRITFHGLRHTHATIQFHRGIDPVTLAERLGWASPAMLLEIYAHAIPKKTAEAATKLDDLY